MSLDALVSKYIASTEHVLTEMKSSEFCVNVDVDSIRNIVEYAKDYLKDAKYYKNKGELNVSLTSIAYCEGLLDALRLLGAVEFEWPERKK